MTFMQEIVLPSKSAKEVSQSICIARDIKRPTTYIIQQHRKLKEERIYLKQTVATMLEISRS